MRITIYTKNNYFELGITAKNAFLDLLVCGDSEEFDAVQSMTPDLRVRVDLLTDEDFGMQWQKESYIEKFKKSFLKIKDGEKFLITSHFAGNVKYFEYPILLNEGKSLNEANDIILQKHKS